MLVCKLVLQMSNEFDFDCDLLQNLVNIYDAPICIINFKLCFMAFLMGFIIALSSVFAESILRILAETIFFFEFSYWIFLDN